MSADDRIRDLTKGVALGLAELERLLRADGYELRDAMVTALAIAEQERDRQVTDERHTPAHDDEFVDGQLGDAAACYLMTPDTRHRVFMWALPRTVTRVPVLWPWEPEDWKPSNE